VERAMVLEDADRIQTASLQISSNGPGILEALHATVGETEAPFQTSLEEAEKSLLSRAIQKSGGNQTRAAVLLGITRDTLRYKMKKFNLH